MKINLWPFRKKNKGKSESFYQNLEKIREFTFRRKEVHAIVEADLVIGMEFLENAVHLMEGIFQADRADFVNYVAMDVAFPGNRNYRFVLVKPSGSDPVKRNQELMEENKKLKAEIEALQNKTKSKT